MKTTIVLVLVWVLSVSTLAQTKGTAVRVRITGVPGTYEVPGVISIEPERRVTGPGGTTTSTDEYFARYVSAAGERPVSVVWPGTRVEGQALGIDSGVLE